MVMPEYLFWKRKKRHELHINHLICANLMSSSILNRHELNINHLICLYVMSNVQINALLMAGRVYSSNFSHGLGNPVDGGFSVVVVEVGYECVIEFHRGKIF